MIQETVLVLLVAILTLVSHFHRFAALATRMEQYIQGQSRDLVDQAYTKFVSNAISIEPLKLHKPCSESNVLHFNNIHASDLSPLTMHISTQVRSRLARYNKAFQITQQFTLQFVFFLTFG